MTMPELGEKHSFVLDIGDFAFFVNFFMNHGRRERER